MLALFVLACLLCNTTIKGVYHKAETCTLKKSSNNSYSSIYDVLFNEDEDEDNIFKTKIRQPKINIPPGFRFKISFYSAQSAPRNIALKTHFFTRIVQSRLRTKEPLYLALGYLRI